MPAAVWQSLSSRERAHLGTRFDAAERAEQLCSPLRPTQPRLTVATLGVRPDHQRRGLATALLESMIKVADDLHVPSYLETSSEGNVNLYSRLDFTVTGHVVVDGGGPTVWAMLRPPRKDQRQHRGRPAS